MTWDRAASVLLRLTEIAKCEKAEGLEGVVPRAESEINLHLVKPLVLIVVIRGFSQPSLSVGDGIIKLCILLKLHSLVHSLPFFLMLCAFLRL